MPGAQRCQHSLPGPISDTPSTILHRQGKQGKAAVDIAANSQLEPNPQPLAIIHPGSNQSPHWGTLLRRIHNQTVPLQCRRRQYHHAWEILAVDWLHPLFANLPCSQNNITPAASWCAGAESVLLLSRRSTCQHASFPFPARCEVHAPEL
jgi:hypothetical protein